ncbi:MAG: trimeric intracellular cation channel family protein [Bowdeniella nasicola]|nr:trimeric intracellular cation channel family protein [Bowdeniella nasicola]
MSLPLPLQAELTELVGIGLPDLFRFLDLTGVVVNGILGGLIARRQRFDAVGFAFLAVISALGGGMLRDVMLQAGPPAALLDPAYPIAALAGAAIAFVARLDRTWWNRAFILADALVLGCWAATGAAKTLSLNLGPLAAIMLGTLTAVGGGMIRDVAVGRIPAVFGGTTLYATAAIAGAAAMTAMYPYLTVNLAMLISTILGFLLCVLARWRRWRLPEHNDWTITLTSSDLRRLVRIRSARPHGRDKLWRDLGEDDAPVS